MKFSYIRLPWIGVICKYFKLYTHICVRYDVSVHAFSLSRQIFAVRVIISTDIFVLLIRQSAFTIMINNNSTLSPLLLLYERAHWFHRVRMSTIPAYYRVVKLAILTFERHVLVLFTSYSITLRHRFKIWDSWKTRPCVFKYCCTT